MAKVLGYITALALSIGGLAGIAWRTAKLISGLTIILTLAACESPEADTLLGRQKDALAAIGLTAAKSLGPAYVGCGADDSLINSARFIATNSKGQQVKGYVCCGWLKACTVRF